jgi:hypothetical protein
MNILCAWLLALPNSPEVITLQPAAGIDETRYPLACKLRLTGTPPARPANAIQARLQALCLNRVRLAQEGTQLEIDRSGTGQDWLPVNGATPQQVWLSEGTNQKSVLVWRESEAWHVASAAVTETALHGRMLQSLDADLDGTHLGELDWLRYNNSAWYLCGKDPLVQTRAGLTQLQRNGLDVSHTLVTWPASVQLPAIQGLDEYNLLRMRVGHAPARLDVMRTLALQQHAHYVSLEENGTDLLEESPTRYGYTAEGAAVLKHVSIIAPLLSPVETLRSTFWTAINRSNFLGDAVHPFAAASVANRHPEHHRNSAGFTWIITEHALDLQLGVPRVCPAPGQTDVATTAQPEWPANEERPELFRMPIGSPITAHFGTSGWSQTTLTLRDSQGQRVLGEAFDAGRPVAPKRMPNNVLSAFFWPAVPLRPGQRYFVELRAKTDALATEESAVLHTWSFVTRAE